MRNSESMVESRDLRYTWEWNIVGVEMTGNKHKRVQKMAQGRMFEIVLWRGDALDNNKVTG